MTASREETPDNEIPDAEPEPKQFGIGAVMLCVTLASLVFGASAALGAPMFGAVLVCLAGTIAIAQRSMFGGRRPMWASMLAGAAFFTLTSLAAMFLFQGNPVDSLGVLLGIALTSLLTGAILGFFVGVVVHAVFLVFFTSANPPQPPPPSNPTSKKNTTLV